MSNSRPLGALLSPCMRAGRCIGCSSKCDCTIDAERCASTSQTQPGSVRGDTAHAAHTQHFAGCWEEGGVGRDLNLAFLAVSRCSLPSWCCSSMLVAASTSGVHPPSTARRHTRVPRHAHACQYHSTRERAPTLAALPHLGLAVFDLPPVGNRWRLLRGLLPDEPVKPSGVLVLLPRRLLPCPRVSASAPQALALPARVSVGVHARASACPAQHCGGAAGLRAAGGRATQRTGPGRRLIATLALFHCRDVEWKWVLPSWLKPRVLIILQQKIRTHFLEPGERESSRPRGPRIIVP